ncbi:hypothetical protein GCM10011531_07090 [Aquaticitalea lipolytica]|uniref:Nucleotide-diphospho-sugar transferase domain-containing protein n=1 Tax=Aquaticitalea lipolytica TaxID=1247562 RepID=A0A8J2TT44_9FLAO|nr:hypothetical protein [Aquaticitalea lipolytica]GFZ79756.1 hypothetical protein GCM10011531_07090 [Aquaticitalea lipolytica]
MIDIIILGIIRKVMYNLRRDKNIEKISKEFSKKNDIECRILCCKDDFEDLLLSLTSFYYYSKFYLNIYIHEDGSFNEECKDLIKEIFPFINVILLDDANSRLKEIIGNNDFYKSRLKLIKDFKFHLRLIDFPFLSDKSRILSIDSDCFFFSNPIELFESIEKNSQYTHCQGNFFSHGNAEKILEEIGFKNELDLKKMPKPGAHIILYPTDFFIRNWKLVNDFIEYLLRFGSKWCDEQGFFDITLKNNFRETALAHDTYIGTFWKNEIKLDDYDFNLNTDNIKVIHCASNEDFLKTTKRRLVDLLQISISNKK